MKLDNHHRSPVCPTTSISPMHLNHPEQTSGGSYVCVGGKGGGSSAAPNLSLKGPTQGADSKTWCTITTISSRVTRMTFLSRILPSKRFSQWVWICHVTQKQSRHVSGRHTYTQFLHVSGGEMYNFDQKAVHMSSKW